MALVGMSEHTLKMTMELVQNEMDEANSRLDAIRQQHNDAVYETAIDTAIFWADRLARLDEIMQELQKEAARCKG